MLIIKASFVAAILSSLLFFEADGAVNKFIEIGQPHFYLDPAVWGEKITFSAAESEQRIDHPRVNKEYLVIQFNPNGSHTELINPGGETWTYVVRAVEKSTVETKIGPNEAHGFKPMRGSIYIKKE